MKGRRNSTSIRVAAWCLTALAFACGDEMKPPENQAPVTVGTITATDPDGLSATMSFTATIVEE